MKRFRYVPQENSKGCGIAVTAMVTGESYEEIRQLWFGKFGEVGCVNFPQHIIPHIEAKGIQATKIKCWKEDGEREPDALIQKYDACIYLVKVFKDSPSCHFVATEKVIQGAPTMTIGKEAANYRIYDPLLGVLSGWFRYHEMPFDGYGFKYGPVQCPGGEVG